MNFERISQVSPLLICIVLLRRRRLYNTENVKKKHRNRKLWARKWLIRRNEGMGIACMVFNELRYEDPSSFKNFTRMTTTTFYDLLAMVRHRIVKQDTTFRESISAKIRLLVTLRYLATGETLQSLSYTFRISQPALSILIPETVDAIHGALKDKYLRTPSKKEEWKKIADKFYELWNFPNCLGALDGKHIAFRARRNDGSFYYNYKGFHSIVLLALVDAEYNFIYVDVGCNGRVNDSGVYNNSELSKAVDENLLDFPEDTILPKSTVKFPYVIVGDDAFRLSRRIMKPYGQRSNDREKIFNYRLSRSRKCVWHSSKSFSNIATQY